MYCLYKSIILRDESEDFPGCRKTFVNKINEWSNVNGSWLIKEGEGKNAYFMKRGYSWVEITLDNIVRFCRRAKA
jgi:hypothetical protein